MSYIEQIYNVLNTLKNKVSKSELPSITGRIKNGTVVVVARDDGIYIEARDKNEHSYWIGSVIAAAKKLEMLEIDLDSIEAEESAQ